MPGSEREQEHPCSGRLEFPTQDISCANPKFIRSQKGQESLLSRNSKTTSSRLQSNIRTQKVRSFSVGTISIVQPKVRSDRLSIFNPNMLHAPRLPRQLKTLEFLRTRVSSQ